MRFNALQCALVALFFFCISPSFSQDCGSNFNLQKLKKDNPAAYQEFLRIEKITENYRAKMTGSAGQRLIDPNGVITIPVVFHVLNRGEAIGTGTNIPDARIFDQVAVLNECFSQINDQAPIPQAFRNVAGNPNFRFVLACRDPNGLASTGILRRTSTIIFNRFTNNNLSFVV